MMSRIPKRTSVVKRSEVSRPPLREMDEENEGKITQMVSGRVSFSRGGTVKGLSDSSFADKTKCSNSSDDSLESNGNDENQSMSANVFDEASAVQGQKKPKRKRVPTVQRSLNSSSSETSILIQSPQRISDTRAVKQPRKSLDSSKTDFSEEGDTQMFFDELNLTEPIMCSYANMDSSLSITRTLIDSVLDNSGDSLTKSQSGSPSGVLSESTLKHSEKEDSLEVKYSAGGVLDNTLLKEDPHELKNERDMCGEVADEGESLNMSVDGINMDCTVTVGNLGMGESFSNVEASIHPLSNISVENASLSVDEDCAQRKKLNDSSASDVVPNHDVTLPDTPIPENAAQSRAEDPLDGTCYLEARMSLTVPPLMKELNLSTSGECQEDGTQNSPNGQEKKLDACEVADEWKQNNVMNSSISSSVNVPGSDATDDKSKLSTSITEKCLEDEISNFAVNVNLEISMRSSQLATEENLEKESLNSCQSSYIPDEAGIDMANKDSDVPSGEMSVSKLEDNLEEDSSCKPIDCSEVALSDPLPLTAEGNNSEKDLYKEIGAFAEKTVLFSNSDGLDETCADMHGMDMTVPLGKIREKMDNSVIDEIMHHNSGENAPLSINLLQKQVENYDTVVEDEKSEEQKNTETPYTDCSPQVSGPPCDDNSQIIMASESKPVALECTSAQQEFSDETLHHHINPEYSGIDIDLSMKDVEENKFRDSEDARVEFPSLEVDSTFPISPELKSAHLSERLKEGNCESPIKPLSQPQLIDDTIISGSVCMEMTVPLGRFKGETNESDYVPLDTQDMNDTNHDSEEINSMPLEPETINETSPEPMGMEFTVPLGKFKEGTHECSVSDSNSEPLFNNETSCEVVESEIIPTESHVMDVTAADVTGMELTIALGRFREGIPECTISNVVINNEIIAGDVDCIVEGNQPHDFKIMEETRPEVKVTELSVPVEGFMGKFSESDVNNEVSSSQVISRPKDESMESGHTPTDVPSVDETLPEAIEMEVTIPLERIKEHSHENIMDEVLSVSQVISETTLDGNSMRFFDASMDEQKTCSVSNPEVVDWIKAQAPICMSPVDVVAEPSAPLAEEESVNLTTTILEDYNDGDTAKDNAMCLLITSQLAEENRLSCVEKDIGTMADRNSEADASPNSMAVESSEMKDVDSSQSDSPVTLSQSLDDTVSDTMGMEMTLPLGRLKQRRSLYPSKPQSSCEMSTQPINENLFSLSCISGDENTPNSLSENDSPQILFETCSSESGMNELVVGSNDHDPQAEHFVAPLGSTDAKSLEEKLSLPSEKENGRHFEQSDDVSSKPISENEIDMQEVRMELNVSLSMQVESENLSNIPDQSSNCELEAATHGKDEQAESMIPLKILNEDIDNEQPDGEVNCIPELERMEHSLSEAMGGDLYGSKDNDGRKILELNCVGNALETDCQSNSMDTMDRISEERLSLSPSKGSLSGSFINKTAFEDCSSNVEVEGVESTITLTEPNERDDADLILNKLEESCVNDEDPSQEMQVEPSMLKCAEEINHEEEADVANEKQEDLVSDQESMHQSLRSEAHLTDCIDTNIEESELKVSLEKYIIETDDIQETTNDAPTDCEKRLSMRHSIGVKDDGSNLNGSEIWQCQAESPRILTAEQQGFENSFEKFEGLNKNFDVAEGENQEDEDIHEKVDLDQSSADNVVNECDDGEFNLSKPVVELNVTIHSEHDGEAVDVYSTTFNEDLSARPMEAGELGNVSVDAVEKAAYEDECIQEGDEARLNVSLIASDVVECSDSVLNESLESYIEVETSCGDVGGRSSFSKETLNIKLEDAEGEEVGYQEGEECIPQQEAMELSLSEPSQNELPHANLDMNEFQKLSDSSLSVGELMEISNTPVKGLETPKSKNSVHDTSTRRSLEIRLESTLQNSPCAELELNTSLADKNDGQQLEEVLGEKTFVGGEHSPSNISCSNLHEEENKDTDTTFSAEICEEICENSVVVDEKIDVPPSPINAPADVRTAINTDSTNLSTLHDDYNEAHDGDVKAADLSTQELSFANERYDNLSYDPEDTIMTLVDDGGNERIPGESIMEAMSDVSDDEALESSLVLSTAEMKTDPPPGSGDVQVVCEPSNEEKAVETTSVITDPPSSPLENVKFDATEQKEGSKSVSLIEDWIKEESSRESCIWAKYELLENQYSFSVFHGAAVLSVKLMPMNEGEDLEVYRAVEEVKLKSSSKDNYDRCLQVVLNIMLNRLSSGLLSEKCLSTEHLPSLFEFLKTEFSVMNQLLLQAYDLLRNSPVRLKSDSFSYLALNKEKMLLFEVKVNLLNWNEDGVKPEDIQVKNVIGKIGSTEVQSVFQSVRCDEHYLLNTYKEVLNFVSALS
ncbi:serine-rich adhesin for platelets-like [Ischnura elegans]|uniref:serine-rich adhesin for platelets-like n=1 Tax=Ischnura elegans TaxID=197161 RepID=UPI001ED8BDDF|nr:serine-rich adhesin for platelets-like [Ischnura elegans]